ncbi:MAG: polyphenol oxidase family protein [Desulfobacteraceae bacterium]|nr:polyphenol oxidase family protein [Pseudomonadota bacterium]MBU4463336.1 polyphenol oxidase family protein [Pseudomonadota bacterium]MCG2755577.1 polyphenol oxidase family protein [Desulfobacteraceae bacterium]
MILKEKNGILFFQFPNLAEFSDIRHGIFTKNCGHSKNPYQSLNVSLSVGDNDSDVKQNRRIISKCMGGDELVFANQVHETNVLILSKNNVPLIEKAFGKPAVGDAMVADIQEKFLTVQVADCQAVLMYDPLRRVVANVHCGWRGSINNIIGKTIKIITDIFGCNASHIIAGISPSLGPCCAEFINYKTEIPDRLWKYKDRSDHFDFWSLSLDQLCNAGVLIENICLSQICTKCNTDLFFSFRGQGTTERTAAVIGLVYASGKS